VVVGDRGAAIVREEPQGTRLGRAILEDLDGLAPAGLLAVVDLPQIEDGALHHASAAHPLGLDETPIAMYLAVLVAGVAAQEHRAGTLLLRRSEEKRVGLHYTQFAADGRGKSARNNAASYEKTSTPPRIG
jgi:hypothetical protein